MKWGNKLLTVEMLGSGIYCVLRLFQYLEISYALGLAEKNESVFPWLPGERACLSIGEPTSVLHAYMHAGHTGTVPHCHTDFREEQRQCRPQWACASVPLESTHPFVPSSCKGWVSMC